MDYCPRISPCLRTVRSGVLNFFTSDPLAISAAVVFDLGMPDLNVQKVNQTFPALEGAFSQFDEVAIYTYSTTVGRMADFGAVGKRLDAALNQLKADRGENNGVPVTSGPLGPQGPIINNIPYDRSIPHRSRPRRDLTCSMTPFWRQLWIWASGRKAAAKSYS